MSVTSSLYTGVSGLTTLGNSIQVVGNNIANVNTIGYKSSRAIFSDLLSQNINVGGSVAQLGRGVQLEGVQRSFSQGSLLNTDVVTDMAISGRGFFMVSDGASQMYTRAGTFHIDNNGLLVNPDNLEVQGFQFDPSGNPTNTIGTINLSNLSAAANPTTAITLNANMSAGAQILTFDANNPNSTSNHSSSITIHDSLGNAHSLNMYFNKVADNSWEWHALADGAEITGGTPGTPFQAANGTLTFTDTGALDTETTTATTFDFVGGAAQGQAITFDFGDSITTDGGTGLDGTTQFAGSSVTNFQTQDGFEAGTLQTINVNREGVVTGIFSNGVARPVAQVALADFQNDMGLFSVGSNLFMATPESGQPIVGRPTEGSLGEVSANTLEQSNVDLPTEFVTLITNQRGFQANSRIITVGSEMLQEVVNLGR